jgi:hypothetical protein
MLARARENPPQVSSPSSQMKLLSKEVTKKVLPPPTLKKKIAKNFTQKTSPSLRKCSKIASQTDNFSTKDVTQLSSAS